MNKKLALEIVGGLSDLDKIDIIDDPSQETLADLAPKINKGQIDKLIILKQSK